MKTNSFVVLGIMILQLIFATHGAAKSIQNMHIAESGKTLFVQPNGDDKSINTLSTPFATIQHALDIAQAGDTILLMQGEYLQDVSSVRRGHAENPIRITGLPGVVVKGAGKTSIFDIRHSYIELSHFSIDGLFSDTELASAYRKKLVYIKGLKNKGITGVKLFYMDIKNARDECVRIKYQAQGNEIAYSRISYCGAQDFKFADGTKNHNGEAVYIGTAPEQIVTGKNLSKEIDHSNYNWIHHNILEPYGSECIDVKEGSNFNLIEYNICKFEKDLNVGGISIRGNKNIVRYNHVSSNLGAGIRLGGDMPTDGIDNDVYGNYLKDNKNSALKIMREPQGQVCNNTIVTLKGQKPIRVNKHMNKALYTGTCVKLK